MDKVIHEIIFFYILGIIALLSSIVAYTQGDASAGNFSLTAGLILCSMSCLVLIAEMKNG